MEIAKMWKDLLESEDFGRRVVDQEETNEVVALFEKHHIDFEMFGGNLLALLSGGRSRISLLDERPPAPTSRSINEFTNPMMRPVGVPVWMMAAFPDVALWLQEVLDDPEKPETPEQTLEAVYGIDPNLSEGDAEKAFFNADGRIRARCYAHAIDEFITRTDKRLETAVQEGAASDIYAAQSLFNAIGEESNFTLLARNTTMAYVQLRNRYKQSFPSETALIACSGAVDAMVYLAVTHQVDANQIISLAEASGSAADHLLEFMIQFESLLLSVDNPTVSFSEVLDACRDQSEAIARTIREVLHAGIVKDDIANAVELFMNDRKFKRIRKSLSISRR